MDKKTIKYKPIYAICLVLEGGVHDFTGRTFENLHDAQEYLKKRKEELQAKSTPAHPKTSLSSNRLSTSRSSPER